MSEFYDYTDKRVVAVEKTRLKKIPFKTYPVGTRLQARWEGKLYAARVLAVKDGFHLISYVGYGKEWDEWVLADRLVTPAAEVKK